jgi:hypothetical protein
MFPLAQVTNGNPRHSDHRPLIVDCGVKVGYNDGWRDISPKFEAKWLDEEGCLEKVETAWKEALEEGDVEMLQIQKKILGHLHD